MRNTVEVAVGHGPLVVPAREHCLDRKAQLLQRVLRKLLPRLLLHHGQEELHYVLPIADLQLGVAGHLALSLVRAQEPFEFVSRNAQDHLAVHLDEPAVHVVSKPLVAAACGQSL